MASETPIRDAKIVQYLNEAYGKEKQLETALTAHIGLTTRAPYKKRLQQHLRETKNHAKQLERRIKKLGGTPDAAAFLPGPDSVTATAASLAGKAVAAAKGPIDALRGTGEAEKMLKNAKDQFQDEAQEIAHYSAIEGLATALGDKDTAKLAKAIRREEERMRDYLGKLIPQLVKSVATEDVPAAERRLAKGGSRRRAASSRRTASARANGSSRSAAAKPASRSKAKPKSSSKAKASSTRAKASSSRSKSSTSRAKASSSGSSSSRSRAKSSGGATKTASRSTKSRAKKS